VPMILGFDPRYQFVHEDDIVRALAHVTQFDLPGIFNVGADGVLALTEVVGLLGKPYAPVLPPWGTSLALGPLRRLGVKIPPEMLGQLRFGRGMDNRKLKATGFNYRYTTREAVLTFAEHLRLNPILRGMREPYRYEREVEDFLRWSPHVRNPSFRKEGRLSADELVELQKLLSTYGDPGAPSGANVEARAAQADALARAARASGTHEAIGPEDDADTGPTNGGAAHMTSPVEHYDDLNDDEIIGLLDSLEDNDLRALREYESTARARQRVVAGIDAVLARRTGGPVS